MLRGLRRGYAGPAAPLAIEGYESESSAVGTLRAINRGFNAISGGGSNVSISDASGADDLEPPAIEGNENESSAVDSLPAEDSIRTVVDTSGEDLDRGRHRVRGTSGTTSCSWT